MSKKLYRYIFYFVIFIMIISFCTTVKANTMLNNQANRTLSIFFNYLEDGNESVFFYIDKSNKELYQKAEKNLYNYEKIKYSIKDVKETDDGFQVKVKISAEGENWSTSGITAKFNLQKSGYGYKISETDFFDKASPEGIFKLAIIIIFTVFGILAFFGIIIVIIVVVIVISVKKSKKKV